MTLSNQRGQSAPPVIDYEGSRYRTEFWEGQDRGYEDAVERQVLQKLLPPRGRRLVEIGAGYGRLTDLYLGYDQIVLFDYSRTLLQEAVQQWGHDPRFVFVAGNVYQLSLASASVDTLVMVRVMHHLADVPAALSQIRRVLHGRSVAVVEYANKRNLKAIGRWLAGRQSWSPLDPAPVEFVKLNFDFHPAWMWERFSRARLVVEQQMAVSHFRLPLFKRLASPKRLASMESRIFALAGRYPLSPSIFVKLGAPGARVPDRDDVWSAEAPDLFACPTCLSEHVFGWVARDRLSCRACGTTVEKREGIWDFKEPVV